VNSRVGIGTTSPDGPLHIFKSAPNNGDTGPGIILARYDNTYGGCIWSESNNSIDGLYFNAFLNTAASTAYGATPKMVINSNGNVGIGTNDPKSTLEVYKLANANDAPGGGILMSRYKNGDADMRTSAIFSMGYQGNDSIIFKSSTTTTAFSSALPYMRLVNDNITPTLSIVQAANGGIKYSNIFLQSGGSIGRHYESDAGASSGSAIHFSGDSLYPADYAGNINNGVINFGTAGNRWNTMYSSAVDAAGINCSGQIRGGRVNTVNSNFYVATNTVTTVHTIGSSTEGWIFVQGQGQIYAAARFSYRAGWTPIIFSSLMSGGVSTWQTDGGTNIWIQHSQGAYRSITVRVLNL
jgi:hypothetical protein